jgi:trehalose 6-phosphate synthase
MRFAARFIVPMVLACALLAWVGAAVIDHGARALFLFFFALATASLSALTALVARWSWRQWIGQMRDLLRRATAEFPDSPRVPYPEFLPIARDVRELVDRVATAGASGGLWTPQRLKNALDQHLHGERVILVANREPYIHQRGAEGAVQVQHPASGLVTALEPVIRACSGVWIAHGSGTADRETSDAKGRVRVPPGEESYTLRRVWLTPEEERGYYYGFANEGLWPLCHQVHQRPVFRSEDWAHYQTVNRRFADAICDEADSDDPIVLVQDYHFGMVPKLVRERLPRATVLMFWHIPWPNAERFGICPQRAELLQGLLGAGILGFHTQLHCNNFIDSIDRFLEARIDREQFKVTHAGMDTTVHPYPISIEWPSRWIAEVPHVAECRAQVYSELGLRNHVKLGVGVDRLDYTKGIEERLLAVEALLERSPEFRGHFTFVQLAAPSRVEIEAYRTLAEQIDALAARINQRFGTPEWSPVVLRRRHHEPTEVFRFMRAADVCYVSSLHDGMNLVAKEFVAARDDERGVLVLSHFTGASRELTEALIVNPYDLAQAASALAVALTMPAEEQKLRMQAMRSFLREYNVYRWAGRMLADAARHRARDQLAARLTSEIPRIEAVGG